MTKIHLTILLAWQFTRYNDGEYQISIKITSNTQRTKARPKAVDKMDEFQT